MSKHKKQSTVEKSKPVTLLHTSYLTLLTGLLTACGAPQPSLIVSEEAQKTGFTYTELSTGPFTLSAWKRQTDASYPPHIYIEGDGHAYVTRYQASNDPTPLNPTAFKLAQQDPHPNVIYLGRPCQYKAAREDTACEEKKWWTTHRFDRTSVRSIHRALDQLKQEPYQQIHLYGFSGGGALSLITAAERKDVASIQTIAGNVAPHILNDAHRVSTTPHAITPIQFAQKLKDIPQTHFTGGKDRIIKPIVTKSYLDALNNSTCVHHVELEKATHLTGWVENWNQLLTQYPSTCNTLNINEAPTQALH